jgi:ABC-type multidrug transport system fused ATPase/permease subunit
MAARSTVDEAHDQLPGTNQDTGGRASSDGRDLVLKVLGAVGTGIGILGFVTFFGGAILWVRANEAELPASEAVAVVPKGVLVTTGASFLVPAVLLALLALVLIAAIHLAFSIPGRFSTRKKSRKARELRNEADKAIRGAEPEEQIAASTREEANKLSALLADARQIPAATVQLPQMQEQAESEHREAQRREEAAREARSHAEDLNAKAQNEEAELKSDRTNSATLDDIRLAFECVVAFAVLALLPLFTYGNLTDVGLVHALILIGVAFSAAIVSLAVYLASEKFLWFGVVAFIAVGVYTGCATYFRTIRNPKVEPAAALRGTRPPLTGLFIADTPNNLYLGTFRRSNEQPRLLVIPRTQVTDLAVGPLLDPHSARTRAIELAKYECQQQIEQASGGKGASVASVCTKRQKAALIALQSQP